MDLAPALPSGGSSVLCVSCLGIVTYVEWTEARLGLKRDMLTQFSCQKMWDQVLSGTCLPNLMLKDVGFGLLFVDC